MVRVIEGKIAYRNELKGNKNYFEIAGGFQGKSTLVRVSARLELARVRVIRSQLYVQEIMIPFHHSLRTHL